MIEAAHPGTPGGVGERIASARRAIGLTQKQLAEALGTSAWTVERLEAGDGDAAPHLPRIADVTHRQREWFEQPGADENVPRAESRAAERTKARQMGLNLVLGSIVLLVTIRFFSEVVPVVPRAANFIDIPIFLGLAIAAIASPPVRLGPTYLRVGTPAIAFLLLAIASAVVNSQRMHPAPLLVFVYGFLAPLGLYASVYRIWPAGNARALSRVLVGLGVLQLAVVAAVNVPRFVASDGDPDEISGTFGTNAYQLVFFLLIVAALLAGIFALEPGRAIAPLAPVLIFAIFIVILLAQYRALLATTVVTMAAVGFLLGWRPRGITVAVLAAVSFGFVFSYVSSNFPRLKLEQTATTLTQSPWSYAAQRFEATRPIAELYRDDPFAGALGTGPGTFSSRAWQTFAKADSTSASNVQGGYARRLTGGVYETDVSDKYVLPHLERAEIVEGSRAVTSPHSSYLGLAAEVGLFGLALFVGIYAVALLRSGGTARRCISRAAPADALPALALATTIGFLTLLQMGILENWLEVTRATFIVWVMFAVVCKELDSRSPRSS